MSDKTLGRVGLIDRVLRFALGAVLLAGVLFSPGLAGMGTAAQVIAAVVGLVMIGTAAIKFCPLYRILGVCTG